MQTQMVQEAPPIDLGLQDDARQQIADGLGNVLADTYTLYLKTHYYHWNVTGNFFQTLHELFETQYQDLWAATDEIAERIRALGVFSPGTYKEFADRSTLDEDTPGDIPDAETMVANLVKGHETVVRTIRPVLDQADDAGDEVTVDLLTGRLTFHEKTAWMLRSFLE